MPYQFLFEVEYMFPDGRKDMMEVYAETYQEASEMVKKAIKEDIAILYVMMQGNY